MWHVVSAISVLQSDALERSAVSLQVLVLDDQAVTVEPKVLPGESPTRHGAIGGDRNGGGGRRLSIYSSRHSHRRSPGRRPASTTRHSVVNVFLRHVRFPTLQQWPHHPYTSYRSRSIRAGGYGPLLH